MNIPNDISDENRKSCEKSKNKKTNVRTLEEINNEKKVIEYAKNNCLVLVEN